jgi:hypothetical protein
MKKILLALLCCLLLLGCAPETAEPETVPSTTAAVTEPAPTGFYDPNSPLEAATNGAVQCYPLKGMAFSDMLALGDNILLISAGENAAELMLLSGEDLYPTAQLHISGWLSSDSHSLHPWENGISFYEEGTNQTVVLDNNLRVVSFIDAPEGLIGEPILSSDRSTLYYCTADSLRALELDTGISRCLKEMDYPYQVLTGLHVNDTVLECVYRDGTLDSRTMFLSTETGAILNTLYSEPSFYSHGNRYYANIAESSVFSRVFGTAEGQAMSLNLPEDVMCYFLPEDNAAVTVTSWDGTQLLLNYYDLDSGYRTAALNLTSDTYPWAFSSSGDGKLCFLQYDQTYEAQVLCRWDTTQSPVMDDHCYTSIHYTREDPDEEGLAACKAYAEEISSRYGIEVLIHKEAAAVEPFDYDLEYEHLVGVLKRELELLDRNLSRYPEGFLPTLASRFDGISICIVRSLTGSAEAGSLDSADGIQFLSGYRAYIALAAPTNTEYALYHELCHLIDTVVISESGAYDRWDELNPQGFTYDYDYIANQNRDSSAYLQDSSRYFIDTYSMSFPKEDRARIMEYAMTGGNESYFQSPTMQAKLKLLCEGIREAFGLRKSPETFLWEQYLNTSLAYTE